MLATSIDKAEALFNHDIRLGLLRMVPTAPAASNQTTSSADAVRLSRRLLPHQFHRDFRRHRRVFRALGQFNSHDGLPRSCVTRDLDRPVMEHASAAFL